MRSCGYFQSRKEYLELQNSKINVNVENDKMVVVAVAIGACDSGVTENEDVEEGNIESVLQEDIDRLTSQVEKD